MRIALIQQHATEDIDTNIQRGLANLDKAAAQGAEVAVFAELAFTRFYPQYFADGDVTHLAEPVPGPITEKFMAKAKAHNMVAVRFFSRYRCRWLPAGYHSDGSCGRL